MEKKLEYRMYGMVPYNLSDIQKGIQFGHAVVEYGIQNSDLESYKQWAERDKTFIILNGGTTNNSEETPGTLNAYLGEMKVLFPTLKIATFHEPDLGDQLTAICFLVGEKVWNKEMYPDLKIIKSHTTGPYEQYSRWRDKYFISDKEVEQTIELRHYLSQFKLA